MRDQVYYRTALVCTMFLASFVLYVCCHILWRRTTRLISALPISVGVSYILGVTCTVLSALTALHLAGIRIPINWSIVVAQAFEPTIVLIAWSSLYFGIKHYVTVQEQRSRLLASEATARQAQLQALHYQLQPHFLFNTLNAISSLVVSKQPELATEMIAKLAGLMRTTLSVPESHAVTLRDEIAVTEEYLDRTGAFWASSCRLVEHQFKSLRCSGSSVSPATAGRERHPSWVRTSSEWGEIAIKASVVEGQLWIEIENDRSENPLQSNEEGHGLGLANTRTRMEKLYGDSGNITVSTAQKNRFLVSIRFPFTTESLMASQGTGE